MNLDDRELMLVHIAALAAVGPPPASYLVSLGAAMDSGLALEDAQSVLLSSLPAVTSRPSRRSTPFYHQGRVVLTGLVLCLIDALQLTNSAPVAPRTSGHRVSASACSSARRRRTPRRASAASMRSCAACARPCSPRHSGILLGIRSEAAGNAVIALNRRSAGT